MLRFISFGSGSSGNCYLLYTDTDALMIDCGVGVRSLKKNFNSYGLRVSQINNIIITHDHADHVKSVGSLSDSCDIPVYATHKVHAGIHANWCVRKKIKPELTRFVEKGSPVRLGEFEVTPFEVPHDSSDCVGYCVRCEGVTFTIVTDCGHITEDIQKYISESNYLVLEANHDVEMLHHGPYPKYLQDRITSQRGHLSNVECGEVLAGCATPALHHVWLCHLSEENNHPELARKTVESILRDRGIAPGKDFEVEVLKRKTPSEIYELL